MEKKILIMAIVLVCIGIIVPLIFEHNKSNIKANEQSKIDDDPTRVEDTLVTEASIAAADKIHANRTDIERYKIKSTWSGHDKECPVNGKFEIGPELLWTKINDIGEAYEVISKERTIGIPIDGIYYEVTEYSLIGLETSKSNYRLFIYKSPNNKRAVLTNLKTGFVISYRII